MIKHFTIFIRVLIAVLFLLLNGPVFLVCAQQKQVLQIKTLNEQLQPFAFAEVSLDGAPYLNTGNKGTVITEIAASALPVKNIEVKNISLYCEEIFIKVNPLSVKFFFIHIT